uniref:Uncharacterized protein n=1 Tax=Plectus sambesii TaxID=2011161 RepID=A0A914XU97_9BILA
MEELDSSEKGSGPNCIAAEYLIRTTPDANVEQSQPRGFVRKSPSECDYWNKGANTTTLVHHLKRHKRDFEDYLPMKRRYDEERQNRQEDAAKRNKRQTTLEKKLAALFGATRLPLNFINNLFFREFVTTAQPSFTLPSSRAKVRDLIFELHEETLISVKHHLCGAQKVAIILDLWTQASYKYGYLGVSASFLSPLTKDLKVVLLGVRPLNHPHSAKRIQACADNILDEFGLDQQKISRILTDGASNMLKAYKLDVIENGSGSDDDKDEDGEVIKNALTEHTSHPGDPNLDLSYDEESISQEIESDEVEEVNFSRVFPLRLDCYSHRLMRSLANVVDRDPQTRELRKKVFAMVRKFKSKSTAVQALVARKIKCVLLPASMRWNSFSIVVDRLLDIKKDFLLVCTDEDIETIDDNDWNILESVGNLLRPFKRHTNVLQGDKYPTIDHVLPSLLQLQLNLTKMEYVGLVDLPHRLHADMASRFEKILNPSAYGFDATFFMATFLSPSLALILDDDLMECAKENLKKILTAEMKGAVTVAAIAHSSASELSEEQPSSLVSLFPDLMAMAQAKRSTEGVMRGLSISLQAEKILVAYANDLPSSAHCADSLRFWQ